LLHQSTPSHFYKHRGNELEFSQLLNGRVLTCYLRVGERTEVELPGMFSLARLSAPPASHTPFAHQMAAQPS
jgi:hypothetical protein